MPVLAIHPEFVPRIKLFGFVSYKTPWIHFRRTTDEYILYFIKSGELRLHENGTPYALKRGDMLLLEPHLEHEGLEKQPCDYFYVHFHHPDIRRTAAQDPLSLAKRVLMEKNEDSETPDMIYYPKYGSLDGKNEFHRALHEMNEMADLYRRNPFHRSLTGLKLLEWMIGLSRDYLMAELRRDDKRPARSYWKVNALLEYIHGHYTERITGELIEKEFDCNYDYINRVFQEVTGRTITRYVNLVRVNHAKELIEATHLSMSEIGYLTGLNDPFYFSKVFKKYVGLSPSQYDRKMRESP